MFSRGTFSIDGLYDRVPGWSVEGEHWNGWACPAFERAAVDQLLAIRVDELIDENGKMTFDPERDAVVVQFPELNDGEGDATDVFEGHDVLCEDGQTRHVYSVGAFGWCWTEDPDVTS